MVAVDYSGLAFPKGSLRVEKKREKRIADDTLEDKARKAVRRRDGSRCAVPGCREAGVQLHHIVRRSRSRLLKWQTSNLVYLCVAHHQLEHGGKIHISGNADDEIAVTGAKRYVAFKL